MRSKCRGAWLLFSSLLVVFFMVLIAGSLGMSIRAQTIRIKLVNGKNGHPMPPTCVNIWVGDSKAIVIPTDKDAVAWLRLTRNAAEVSVQNHWSGCGYFGVINPIVNYGDSIRIDANYVSCVPRIPNHSKLVSMTFSMAKVLQSGIVGANVCGKAKASPEPGEVVLFARRPTFWEKLTYIP